MRDGTSMVLLVLAAVLESGGGDAPYKPLIFPSGVL